MIGFFFEMIFVFIVEFLFSVLFKEVDAGVGRRKTGIIAFIISDPKSFYKPIPSIPFVVL